MFGIGFQEIVIILVVALIFFGPKRLPDLAKSLGKGIAEFKKASEEVRKGIEDAVKEESAGEDPKPPEDLSSYGKAPGSAAAHPGETPPDNPPVEPAPSTGAPAPASGAAPGTATGETPATPPRQG
jgi:TatA/E family protein of Tat protein translocase